MGIAKAACFCLLLTPSVDSSAVCGLLAPGGFRHAALATTMGEPGGDSMQDGSDDGS